jgi:hypothetical protein
MNSKHPIEGRDERGRTTVLPLALRPHMFRKGDIHNPAGKGGEYQRCLKLCRESSHEAAEEIVRLSKESEDERVRYMAATWIFERAWGKPKEYDAAQENDERPKFNPRLYTPSELDLIERALRLMVESRGASPGK